MNKNLRHAIKAVMLFVCFSFFINETKAQTFENGIFFQALARDNYFNPAKDRKIFVQAAIIQSSATGTKVLVEEFQVTTDASGVFGISIGKGVRTSGTLAGFNAIDWSAGPYFLNIQIAISPVAPLENWDYTKDWIDLGTTSFGTVPYALHAKTVAGFDTKLNVSDTTKMLANYAKTSFVNTKLNIKDSITSYVTPSQLIAAKFDTTNLSNRIDLKANATDLTTGLANKVDKVTGKDLSTNDYTTIEKTKLAAITGTNTGDQDLSGYATITNLAIKANAIDVVANTSAIATNTANILANTNNIAANTANITANTNAITTKADISSLSTVATSGSFNDLINTPANLVKSIGNIGTTSNANGATIAAGALSLTPADASNGGIVTTGAQTFAGNKIVSGNLASSGLISAGTVTYPNAHGTSGQVLSTTGSGTLTWTTPTTVSVGTISSTSNAKGATIAGGVLSLAPADASNGGIVTTSTQSFTGNKTFIGNIVAQPLLQDGVLDVNANNPTSPVNAPGSDTRQSFTSGATGYLTSLKLLLYSTGTYTLTIYQGGDLMNQNTPGGVQLYQTTFSSINNVITTIPISNLRVTSGTQYWFKITGSTFASALNWGRANVGTTVAFPGYYAGLTQSLIFQTYVSQSLGGGSISSTGTITAGDVTYPSAHGTSGQVLSTSGSGTLSWSTPTNVSVGTISTTSNANGATISGGVLSLAPADASNGGIVTTGDQAFTGVKTFNSGINFVKVNSAVLDQSNPTAANSIGGNNVWQSFTAGITGKLSSVEFKMISPLSDFSAATYTIKIYSGEGITGTLLGTGTAVVSGSSWSFFPFDLSSANISIVSGQQYTMFITTPILYYANLYVNVNNSYAGGRASSFADWDLVFKSYVSPTSLESYLPMSGGALTGNLSTSGSLTAGAVTYPNAHGTNGQVLSTTGSGTLTWTTVSGGGSGVPYTGATSAVNLGAYDLTANGMTIGLGSGYQSSNAVLGTSAMSSNTTGGYSVAVGFEALKANTSGNSNTALGYQAMHTTSSGGGNIAIGMNAMLNNTIGQQNTAIGQSSLNNNSNASANVAIGNTAGAEITTGGYNTIVGTESARGLSTGSWNTILGRYVYSGNVSNNIIIGNGQGQIKAQHNGTNWVLTGGLTAGGITYPSSNGTNGQVLTTNGSGTANWSTISGVPYTGATGPVNLGAYNLTVNGISVGRGNGNNDESVAIGAGAMGASNINGKRNTAIGMAAMSNYVGTSWDNNTSVGYRNLPSMTTGSGNTSVGAEAMLANLTGVENTSVGNQSLINTTGNNNIGIGKRSGQTNTSGSQNTIVGTDADVTTNNLNNATAIGYGANVAADNTIQLGNTSVTNVKTSGTITAGAVTYPKVDGTNGQVLSTNGSGTLVWTSPSSGVDLTTNQTVGGSKSFTSNIRVGTETPTSSAVLEANSTNQGFLPPRMTSSQRDQISTPAIGLMIYCTNCGTFGEPQYYNGETWINFKGIIQLPNVTIGAQVWASANLNVSQYRNGDNIPQVTDPTVWSSLTTGAWCWYNNDSVTYAAKYGKLYNWYAVNDPRGLAPAGYHIPTNAEWTTLTNYLGGLSVAGGAMKQTGTTLWNSPNTSATNSSGFAGLPGGLRASTATFYNVSTHAFWWAATENVSNTSQAWRRYLYTNDGNTYSDPDFKTTGNSVRCVKD